MNDSESPLLKLHHPPTAASKVPAVVSTWMQRQHDVCQDAAVGQSALQVSAGRCIGSSLAILAAGGLATAAMLACDMPLARFLTASKPHGVQSLLNRIEVFGHGSGLALIALVILLLDPGWKKKLLRVVATPIASGLLANLIKMSVGRTRPYATQLSEGVWHSFTGWLPVFGGGSRGQSFPSAHAAHVVALSLALATVYPRARWLFWFLAGCVCAQRVVNSDHFLSDVMAGATLGCFTAYLAQVWLARREAAATMPQSRSSPAIEQASAGSGAPSESARPAA